jgi:hypothetical protein
MKRLGIIALTLGFMIFLASGASAFFMNFEEGLGNDGGLITGIPGVTFTTSGGQTWRYGDATTNNYNVFSVNTGNQWLAHNYNMYDYVFAWTGTSGNQGRIDFDDQNGTWFTVGISSYSNFYITAYDAGGNVLDTASTGPCTRDDGYTDMVFLTVTGTDIAYVILHDSGNYWCLDNMSGDMAGGVVPIPGALWLLGSGLLGLGGFRFSRRRS